MSSIVPEYKTVKVMLGQSFKIDVYQREYKWERKHVEQLLTDLFNKFTQSYQEGDIVGDVKAYADYFLGSVIISKKGVDNFIVDGQQRITTLTLLLIYLAHVTRDYGYQRISSTMQDLIYSDNFGELEFNLDIPERKRVMKVLYEGGDFNADDIGESVRNIYDRYQDILDRNLADELAEELDNEQAIEYFSYWLVNKVGMIEISTTDNEYAYAIFETMNDRGKPLSPVDMLKAYMLAPIVDDADRKMTNKVWQDEIFELITWGGEKNSDEDASCIKAWLRAQYAMTIRQRKAGATEEDWDIIGTAFHRWIRDNSEHIGVGSNSQNVSFVQEEFTFFAKVYRQILDASENYTPGLEAIYYNAHNRFTLQSTVLLAPLMPTDDEETVRQKLAITARYLDIWIIRRVSNYVRVTYSSSSYTMFNLCKDIRRKSVDELIDILTLKLEQDEVTFDGYEQRGRNGITSLHLNQFTKRYIYHMLARITSYVESESDRADRFVEYVDRDAKNPYDIEHIVPNHYEQYKDVFETEEAFLSWRDHIAGLLLLPADVNRSYQDKPYHKKVHDYARENLYAASLSASGYEHKPRFKALKDKRKLPFEPFETFGISEQNKRRELIYQLVNLIWSPDRLKEELV